MNVNFTNVKFFFSSSVSVKEIVLRKGKLFVILLLMNMIYTLASAQTKLITGSVLDEKGEGIPGVSITLKGTTSGISSDVSGNFSISVPDGKGTLVFHFIGYTDQEVVVNGQTKIQVQIEIRSKGLEELVVVGYGTTKKDLL